MKYFQPFPLLEYGNFGDKKLTRNILLRTGFRKLFRDNSSVFYEYEIGEEETPQIIADRIYGDSNLYWLIFLFNEITDPYTEFYKNEKHLENFINRKYSGSCYFINPVEHSIKRDDPVEYGTNGARIRHWNPTLMCFAIYGNNETIPENSIAKINGIEVDIVRVDPMYSLSLHHFEDLEGNMLDPLGSLPRLDGTQEQFASNRSNQFLTLDFSDTLISLYHNRFSSNLIHIVNNTEFEILENEKRRKIRLVQPQYLNSILELHSRLLNQ